MGRNGWVSVLAFLVVTSGCVSDKSEEPEVGPSGLPGSSTPLDGAPSVAQAPSLAVGTGWTYRTGGVWDQVETVTIVVAESGPRGYLLAAETDRMLEDEIAWDLSYLGRFDAKMRSLNDEKYGGELSRSRLLDFPLEHGKSWAFYDVTVTAAQANLTILGKTVPGWRITGEDAKRSVRIEYAPSIGFVTLFEEVSKSMGKPLWSLRLEEQHESKPWVWFKRNAEVVDAGAPNKPSTLFVTSQDESVFVWSTGTAGSRGVVAPPNGQPAHFETEGGTKVRTLRLAAQEGTWAVSGVASAPDGSIYTQAHAIDWMRSTD